MKFVYLVANLILSLLAVFVQREFPFSQWIIIYAMVFIISWFGGFMHGMISTVISLSFAGWYLIPAGAFQIFDLLQLMTLTVLGFWISYSMEQYRYSSLKLSASEEVVKSFGFLDTLIESIPLMIFVKDAKELRFVKFNRAGLDLIGVEKEDLIGKNDFDMFPPKEAKHFTDFDRKVLEGRGIVDIPNEVISTMKRGERILHTKKIPILDKNGHPIYLLGVSEDITEKVEADAARIKNLANDAAKVERLRIQEKEILMANTISSLSTTLDYNETLRRIVEIVVPALGDWSILTLKNEAGEYERLASFHHDPALRSLLDEFQKNFPPSQYDVELMKALEKGEASLLSTNEDNFLKLRSNNQRKYELYLALDSRSSMIIPIKYRDKCLAAISIVRGRSRPPFDELDLAFAEEFGRRAGAVLENSLLFKSTQKAVKARDEFISIASHELKTPITSLKLQLQILQRSRLYEGLEKPLKNAVHQIDRLTLLVNDLLDVGKYETGKMTYHFADLKIGQLVQEVSETFKNQFLNQNILFSVEVATDVSIKADKHRLEQVLINLLNNAFKYGEHNPIKLSVFEEDRKLVISVKDSGKGIPLEFQKKIFHKFERGTQDLNISGLGLGLFISKEIISAHNGTIELISSEGNGSEFRVILPIV